MIDGERILKDYHFSALTSLSGPVAFLHPYINLFSLSQFKLVFITYKLRVLLYTGEYQLSVQCMHFPMLLALTSKLGLQSLLDGEPSHLPVASHHWLFPSLLQCGFSMAPITPILVGAVVVLMTLDWSPRSQFSPPLLSCRAVLKHLPAYQ